MENLKNKTVFITGASAGIGEATATAFAASGSRLLLAARRKERLEDLARKLASAFKVEVRTINLDVRDRPAVTKALAELKGSWEQIDILVNNAGLGRGMNKLHEGEVDDWEEMIDTNVKGLLYVSREVIPGMVKRAHGHIINVGSVAGHEVYPGGNVYCATKHAVDALTHGMRIDLVDTPVRVSTVDPGLVETEFSIVRFKGDVERAKKPYANLQPLVARDIAEIIVFIASRPAHVNINEVIVMPTSQATATLAHRSTSS